jgi:hypothetical protein
VNDTRKGKALPFYLRVGKSRCGFWGQCLLRARKGNWRYEWRRRSIERSAMMAAAGCAAIQMINAAGMRGAGYKDCASPDLRRGEDL